MAVSDSDNQQDKDITELKAKVRAHEMEIIELRHTVGDLAKTAAVQTLNIGNLVKASEAQLATAQKHSEKIAGNEIGLASVKSDVRWMRIIGSAIGGAIISALVAVVVGVIKI